MQQALFNGEYTTTNVSRIHYSTPTYVKPNSIFKIIKELNTIPHIYRYKTLYKICSRIYFETYNHKLYRKLTASLTPRDKEICLMFLDEHIPKAKRLNYIASRYNITNQRASQIKQRIIKKLKSTVIRKGLTFNE